MITTQNYYSDIQHIGVEQLPEALKKSHELVNKVTQNGSSWETYHANTTIKRVIDLYLQKLNEYLQTSPPLKKETTGKKLITPEYRQQIIEAKQEAKKVTKQEKQQAKMNYHAVIHKEETAPSENLVERLDEEIKFIKRYVALDGKVKTDVQLINFIDALQKAILERRIRKTSPYAQEIENIQENLVKAYNSMVEKKRYEAKFSISETSLQRLTEIAGSEMPMLSIAFIKRYVNMNGRKATKEKVQKLYAQINAAVEKGKITEQDKYFDKLQIILRGLFAYLHDSKPSVLKIETAALNGLLAAIYHTKGKRLAPCTDRVYSDSYNKQGRCSQHRGSLHGVMSIDDAKQASFDFIGLDGKWKELIGTACKPTHFFVYGMGGSGKTSFVLLFSQYLAGLGYKILYVAGEQFGTPTFTELLNRLNITAGDNFKIVDSLNRLHLNDFDFVVLDSKDHLGVELEKFIEFKKNYPNQSFIILSQATKTGNFTGSEKWRNEVDVMLLAENGTIRTG